MVPLITGLTKRLERYKIDMNYEPSKCILLFRGGKEVVMMYTANMETGGIFYTDANGRQMVERKRTGMRDYEPESRNYYPITTRIINNIVFITRALPHSLMNRLPNEKEGRN